MVRLSAIEESLSRFSVRVEINEAALLIFVDAAEALPRQGTNERLSGAKERFLLDSRPDSQSARQTSTGIARFGLIRR
ncbi:hypothetical protein VFPBJ_03074 [Purpureocillium lilacinum]|uniref:Uncharacterized protein n=1 Tax=Purpureocillium lilacinum TaxID=33203 RepID=A0A179H226_PURLI|nr:hypothetical protein VFPBJ_03074 [Purpureocillium lilacinum]